MPFFVNRINFKSVFCFIVVERVVIVFEAFINYASKLKTLWFNLIAVQAFKEVSEKSKKKSTHQNVAK
jgi:hypothetical protein